MTNTSEGSSDETEPGDEAQGSETQAPTKVCRSCSVQTETNGAFCPNCGQSYEHKRKRKLAKKTKIFVVLAIAAVFLIGSGGAAAFVIAEQQAQAEFEAARILAVKDSEAAAAAEAEQAAADEAVAAAEAEAERAYRSTVTDEVEASILQRANELVDDGLLTGPMIKVFCNPLGGGSIDDLTALTTTFDCLAANEDRGEGQYRGYSFDATANWSDGTYTYGLSR